MSRKLNIEDIRQEFKDNGCTLLSTEYKGHTVKLDYICVCSNHHTGSLAAFRRGHRCGCGNKRRAQESKLAYSEVKQYFEDNGCILLEPEYINAHTKMKYICSCGNNKASIEFTNFRSGQRCRACGTQRATNKHKHKFETVRDIFTKNGCVLLEEKYDTAHTPMNYQCSCGVRSKISFVNFRKGVRCSSCAAKKREGENNPRWNFELTDEDRLLTRAYPEYADWRNKIFIADDYTCTKCNAQGGTLNAHHIKSYSRYPELRTEVSNGITLCQPCHTAFHKTYGYSDFTEEDLNEFMADQNKKQADTKSA